jgi:hypothetical protein
LEVEQAERRRELLEGEERVERTEEDEVGIG